jgi:hypothetical protein
MSLDDFDVVKEAEEIINSASEGFFHVFPLEYEEDKTVSSVVLGIGAILRTPRVGSMRLEKSSQGVYRLKVYFTLPPDKTEEDFPELKQKLEGYEYMHGASGSIEAIVFCKDRDRYELTMYFHP